ncbi:hypothetical protein QL285_025381 [Trifolium repens]|nr:hypothetical protein QL285_025381 [Trifolium repens]
MMQNYQHLNSQNSQFLSPPTNANIFLSPPTNPNMFYRPQMNTQGVEFTRDEHETPIGSMSKSNIPHFSTQIGHENIRLEDGERSSIKKKNLESYSQGMRIHFSFNHGSMFQRIHLWELIKKQLAFG